MARSFLVLSLVLAVAGRLRARRAAESFHCTIGNFYCHDGDLVPLCLRCDGTADCQDGSDESGCQAAKVLCGPRGQQCSGGGPCLPLERFCDGHANCPDGSDELGHGCQHSASWPCQKEEFRCAPNADCFPITWVCDGHPDCPDGRDERECSLDSPSTVEILMTGRTDTTESPETVMTEHWTIIALIALAVVLASGVVVGVWIRPRVKPLLDKASERLLVKEQP